MARADAAFERVHEEEVVTLKRMPRNRTDAVGFKLMYSQIWDSRPLTKKAPPTPTNPNPNSNPNPNPI